MQKQLYKDEELLELLAAGGRVAEQAFTEIYDKYAVRIRAYCYTVMQDSDKASDVFQDTFIRFYKAATTEKKEGTPIAWLLKIARNLCLNAKRDAKPNIPIDSIELGYEENSELDRIDNQKMLDIALSKLDGNMREAVALRFYEDMPYESIAEILDITTARARYLVFTAKGKMKNTLELYLKEK